MMPRQSLWGVLLGMVLSAGCQAERAEAEPTPSSQGATRASASAIAPLAVGAVPEGGDWAQFRGPGGLGTATAKSLPVSWSREQGIVWQTPLPGAGASSPIVFGERIYLTAYTGYLVPGEERGDRSQLQRHLIALSRETGKVIWDKAVPAVLPEEENIRDHGFAASTPAADAERVYVFFGKTGALAFDHEGQQLWQTSVGTKTHGWGSSASPVLYQDLVIVNASVESESLVALNAKTGKEVWRAKGVREAWNTPILIEAGGRTELVVATQPTIQAYDPRTGKSLWTCQTDITWYMAPSMVAHEGVVYAVGGRSGITALAVRGGGAGDVTATHRLWTIKEGSNVSSPVYHEGHLYFANDSRGVAYCVEAKTGQVVYEQRLERAGQVYASAVLGAGHVYYTTREGKTFVVAAQPKFEQAAANDLSDRSIFNASAAVDGNRLLIRSDKFLYCVGK